MSASLAVQRLVRAALATVPGLTGVFDGPAPDAVPPYAVIGPDLMTDWGHKTGAGHEHRVGVSVWTAGPGVAAAKSLAAAVEAALADLPGQSRDGQRVVVGRLLRSLVLAEPGGWSRALIEFRLLTEEIAGG